MSIISGLSFYLPALSHLLQTGAFYWYRCEGRQWAPLRMGGTHSSAISGGAPRLADFLWLTILAVLWEGLSPTCSVGDGRGRAGETLAKTTPQDFVPSRRPWPNGHVAQLHRQVQPWSAVPARSPPNQTLPPPPSPAPWGGGTYPGPMAGHPLYTTLRRCLATSCRRSSFISRMTVVTKKT